MVIASGFLSRVSFASRIKVVTSSSVISWPFLLAFETWNAEVAVGVGTAKGEARHVIGLPRGPCIVRTAVLFEGAVAMVVSKSTMEVTVELTSEVALAVLVALG